MIARYTTLCRYPKVFRSLTGLSVDQFDDLVGELQPAFEAAEAKRLCRPDRQRAMGGGRRATLALRDQVLLTVVWLRRYPIFAVLGFLFGVDETTALRTVHRLLPLLEAAGTDSFRLADPGKWKRPQLADLLADTPELAVIIDTFEQRVQRPQDPDEAKGYYSGKKKQHTLKSQVAVFEPSGQIVEVADSVRGPVADIRLLAESGLLARLPAEVGAMGDLAYLGLGPGHSPRRKPRGQPRPAADRAYNTAFAKRRVVVEHTIGRLRRYEALSQTDRHHRRLHTERVRAVAGLVNRRLTA